MRKLPLAILLLALLVSCGQCPGPDPTPEKVTVEVCLNSLKLANEWCPFKGMREYVKGQEPTTYCEVHKKPDEPEPQPKIKVYVEALDLLNAVGDWRLFLSEGKRNGAWGYRFICDFAWNGPGTRPYEYAAYDEDTAEKIRHKDPNDEKDIQNDGGIMVLVRESGARFPLFDYTRPRAEYWNKLAEVFAYAKEIDTELILSLLDYSTLKTAGDAKYFSPWYCAVQRMLPGVQNGTWGEQMKPWIAAFYKRVIEAAKASGVRFMVEDMNEGWALGWPDAFVKDWFTWSNTTIRELGIPKERIVSSVAMAEIAQLAGYFSLHGVGRPEDIKQVYGLPYSRLMFSSDGFKSGTGPADAKGKRGVGVDAAPALQAKMIEKQAFALALMDRRLWSKNDDRADLSLFSPTVLRALAGI
jgi:hypothetical protein